MCRFSGCKRTTYRTSRWGYDHTHVLECVGPREAQRELMHSAIHCLLESNDEIEMTLRYGADDREIRKCMKSLSLRLPNVLHERFV